MYICRRCMRNGLGLPMRAALNPHHGTVSRQVQTSTSRLPSDRSRLSKPYTTTSPRERSTLEWKSRNLDKELNKWLDQDSDPAPREEKDVLERRVFKTLANYRDPFMVAKHVQILLSKGRHEEALLTIRQGSKGNNLVVAWNHYIEHLLAQNKLRLAIKVYNEMKKRNQLPNAQTYTIIFKGCASHISPKTAVAEATRLYNSMMRNERMKPNTIHMNSVVQTCARAGDLEAMFSILQTANEGLRAPDAQTYTAIFNGLRHKTAKPNQQPVDDLATPPATDPPHVSIARATALWEEIISRWKGANLIIDEEMVCAMARVLQTGGVAENEAVLALLEQTMNIPRYDKSVKSSDIKSVKALDAGAETAQAATEAPVQPATFTSDTVENTADPPVNPEGAETSESQVTGEVEAETVQEVTASQFPVIPQAKGLFAKPGNNTLAVLLISLLAIKKTNAIAAYWRDITSHGVVPDPNNWFQLIKGLRTAGTGSSTIVAEMMPQMPLEDRLPTFFRSAMSVCQYDLHCDACFANAGKILDLANHSLRYPDPTVLRIYLRIALDHTTTFRKQAAAGDVVGAREGFGRQIFRALDRLWDPLRLLTNSLSYPTKKYNSPQEEFNDTYRQRLEIVALARRMIAAADKLQGDGMVTGDELTQLKTRRNLLNRQVSRFIDDKAQYTLSPEMAERKKQEEASLLKERKHWQGLNFWSKGTQDGEGRTKGSPSSIPPPPRPQGDGDGKFRIRRGWEGQPPPPPPPGRPGSRPPLPPPGTPGQRPGPSPRMGPPR